jgi:hypothetical protein
MNAPKRGPRALTYGLAGAVLGFLIGTLAIGVLWIVVFSQALSGQPTLQIPGVIEVAEGADYVSAILGPALLLAPLVLAIVGVVVGVLIARARKRRIRQA